MRQLLIVGLFFLLISPSLTLGETNSCIKNLNEFVNDDLNTYIGQLPLTRYKKNDLKKIKSFLAKLEWTEEESKQFFYELTLNNKTQSFETISHYLYFVDSLHPQKKKLAISHFRYLDSSTEVSPILKQFRKDQMKIQKYSDKYHRNLEIKISEEHPDWDEKRIVKETEKKFNNDISDYKRIYHACRSFKPNVENKEAFKRLRNFMMGIGATSTLGYYAYYNYDKFGEDQWFEKLGYELVASIFWGWLVSKAVSNPLDTPLKKGFKRYMFGATIGWVDTRVYANRYGVSEKEAEQRLKELLTDPEASKKLEELLKKTDDLKLYPRFKKEFMSYIKKFIGKEEAIPNTFPADDIDWDNLTYEKLEKNPQIFEKVMTAMLDEIYEEDMGQWIQTGDKGADRYVYGALLWPALSLLKDVPVDLLIFRIFCTEGAISPRKALFKAITIYTFNRLIFDRIHFKYRQEAIGQ